MAISVGVNGIVNMASGNGFFDNVGDTLANSFMFGGIMSGGSQMLSGAGKLISNGSTNGKLPVSNTSVSANPVPACFIAGTLVLASIGFVAIEDIKAGDYV
jgi:hypothetical protein